VAMLERHQAGAGASQHDRLQPSHSKLSSRLRCEPLVTLSHD
jgi:hypothetical protein